jgi:MFS family permease
VLQFLSKTRDSNLIPVIAPMSEMYGRLPLYHACNVLFISFTVGAAVSTSMSMFIVFRFFMGCMRPFFEHLIPSCTSTDI